MPYSSLHLPGRWLPVLFLLVVSCRGREAMKLPADEPNTPAVLPAAPTAVPARAPGPAVPWADPSFVELKDTVSRHGPRDITRTILQDRAGHFWLASWEGIIRYDGRDFTNFTYRAGLRHFHVLSILEDRYGNLWFGTIGAGVYRFDGRAFTNITRQDGLPDDVVLCMLEDRAGYIWFGTPAGASRYDGHTFVNYSTKDGLTNNFVNAILQDNGGKLWFGTDGGVCTYDDRSFVDFTRQANAPFWKVRSMLQDNTGNLWFGSAEGLYRYDGTALTRLLDHSIGSLLEDRAGNLWISADQQRTNTMTLYRYEGRTFTDVLANDRRRYPQVFALCEDTAGGTWFGTIRGVCRYDGKIAHWLADGH